MRPSPATPVDHRLASATAEGEVRVSVAVLGVVIVFALTILATDGNWPKFLRVGLAFAAYALVLLVGTHRRAPRHPERSAPYWLFAAAGASAGVVSGLVRTTVDPAVVVIGALGGALLLGTVHWAGVRRWRQVRARL